MTRVIVVGAGVVGLTCAVRLLEAGHRVDLLARDLPLETTSAVAAAFWYPYLAEPRDRVLGWATASYERFRDLAAGPEAEASGVSMRPGTELLREPTEDPWWAATVPDLTRVTAPTGYAAAWSFAAPVIEMPLHLPWLLARVEALGGTVTRLNLSALPAPPAGGVVVDCSGLGARLLAADPSVTPVAGQVVVVAQTGVDRWWLDEGEPGAHRPTYVVPRTHDVVVGGTEDVGEWSRTPSPETADQLLARAGRLEPRLIGARVLRHRVGLRPVRPTVRLERVGDVVHCYGHGGAGVTLAWGCAGEVTDLVGSSIGSGRSGRPSRRSR